MPATPSSGAVFTELWTSWASLLRSYAAAHGLNATCHAVVEISADLITLRAGARCLRFTSSTVHPFDEPPQRFTLHDDGTATVGDRPPEDMDIVAEHFARELLFPD